MRVMVCRLPPARAGRAPQASRHSKTAEATGGEGAGGTAGARGGPVGTGLEPAAAFVKDFQHPLTMAATPALPASRSSQRRLTSSVRPSIPAGGNFAMTHTIRSLGSDLVSNPLLLGATLLVHTSVLTQFEINECIDHRVVYATNDLRRAA